MAQTFQGDVSFSFHNQPTPHRFEVSVTNENKIILWIEDRQTKKQWHTDALDTKAFVTEDNAIPKATSLDYAERFAACLGSTDESANYGRALTTKGGERILILVLPFQWAQREPSLEYKLTMNEVPLERIDILGARMRDVEDKVSPFAEDRIRRLEQENEALKARIEEEVSRAPIFAQAKMAAASHDANQILTWTAGDGNADGVIQFLSTGHVEFIKPGVYALDIGVTHGNRWNSVIFELKKSGDTLASCNGSSYQGYYSTTPLHYVLKAKAHDKIHIIYKASGNAYQTGAFLAITKL